MCGRFSARQDCVNKARVNEQYAHACEAVCETNYYLKRAWYGSKTNGSMKPKVVLYIMPLDAGL